MRKTQDSTFDSAKIGVAHASARRFISSPVRTRSKNPACKFSPRLPREVQTCRHHRLLLTASLHAETWSCTCKTPKKPQIPAHISLTFKAQQVDKPIPVQEQTRAVSHYVKQQETDGPISCSTSLWNRRFRRRHMTRSAAELNSLRKAAWQPHHANCIGEPTTTLCEIGRMCTQVRSNRKHPSSAPTRQK